MKLTWSRFVDIITIVWFVVFILTFFDFDKFFTKILDYTALFLLFIFILDLVFLYKKSDSSRSFLKYHWFDIIMVIPFFRILRIFRVFRLLKVGKSIKAGVKYADKSSKAIKKAKRMKRK